MAREKLRLGIVDYIKRFDNEDQIVLRFNIEDTKQKRFDINDTISMRSRD